MNDPKTTRDADDALYACRSAIFCTRPAVRRGIERERARERQTDGRREGGRERRETEREREREGERQRENRCIHSEHGDDGAAAARASHIFMADIPFTKQRKVRSTSGLQRVVT